MGAADGVPRSASGRLPLKFNTVWSTVMEPPTMGLLPPACSYWVRKFTASAPPSTTRSASTSPGSLAITDEWVLQPRPHPALVCCAAGELAVLGHEALHLGVREGVVLGDQGHLLVSLVLEGVLAQ